MSFLHCSSPASRKPRMFRPSLEMLEGRCVPTIYYWVLGGDTAGDWNVQANWRDSFGQNGVPGADDSAVFLPIGDEGTAPANVNVGVTIARINITSSYTRTITLSSALTIDGGDPSAMAGGTISGAGDLTIRNSTFNWSAGTIGSGGVWTVETTATLDLSGSATKTLNERSLSVQGTLNWTAGNIQLSGAATIQVQAPEQAATINASANHATLNVANAAQNTLQIGQGAQMNVDVSNWLDIKARTVSTGHINVQSGQLWLSGGSVVIGDGNLNTNVGRISLAANTHISLLEATTLDGAKLRGAGTTWFGNGTKPTNYPTVTITGNVYVQNVADYSSSLEGTGTLIIEGGTYYCYSSQWIGGAQARVEVRAGSQLNLLWGTILARKLEIDGIVTFNANANLTVQNGGAIEVKAGGLFDIRCAQSIAEGGGAGQFLVRANGVLRKSAGGGVSQIGIPYTNEGRTEQQNGRIEITAQALNFGTIDVTAGSFGAMAGLTQEAGLISVAASTGFDVVGTFEVKAGTASFDGTLDVTGNYQQTAGIAWMGADAVTIAGQALVSGGVLTLHGPVSVAQGMEILAGGLLQIGADGAVNGSVVNKGIISVGALAAGQTLIISGDFTQTAGGTLRLELGIASDHVGIGGNASLAGTLEVGVEEGYTPSIGVYTPISWGSFSGEFDAIYLPALPEPDFWIVQYDEFGLNLIVETESS